MIAYQCYLCGHLNDADNFGEYDLQGGLCEACLSADNLMEQAEVVEVHECPNCGGSNNPACEWCGGDSVITIPIGVDTD